MNFRRILANAVARRVAFVLVAAAFAWLGIGNARAQTYPSEGAAYAACMENAAVHVDASPSYRYGPHCQKGHANFYTSQYWSCAASGHTPPCSIGTGSIFAFLNACSARPNYVGSPPTSTMAGLPVGGALSCVDGCAAGWFNNGDGTWTGTYAGSSACTNDTLKDNCSSLGDGYFWNAYAQLCQPPKAKCDENQTQDSLTGACVDSCPAGMVMDANGVCDAAEDECPAGNVKAPSGECLPGDGQCAAGEARRPNGTCGKDSDGDGEADEDDEDPENDPEEETASGGDSCDSPPSCSGGAIACMQVKIQWRIDCNTRKAANVSGGTCASIPVCTGKSCDALEYSQLLQQWKAACALEKIAAGGSSGGGDGDAVVDLLTAPGSINSNAGGGDTLSDGDPWADEGEEHEPDASGFGYARSCPSPPSLTLPGGQTVQIDLTPLCNWVSLGGSIVLILSGLMCLRIVSGGTA
jgi:hypothetical protein